MTTYQIADFEYQIKICDHILDKIYGQIGLPQVEKKIEFLPIFKRLHRLSQLGLVSWIFPCALHNRYTHSIGVMYVAGEIATRININMGKPFFCDSEIQILRLAGLLHDIGHYPLSHNIELAYKHSQNAASFFYEPVSKNLNHFTNCPKFLYPDYKRDEELSDSELKERKRNEQEDYLKDYSGSTGLHHENIGKEIVTNNSELKDVIKDYFLLINKDGKKYLNPFFAPKDKNGNSVKTIDENELEDILQELLKTIGNLIIGNYGGDSSGTYPWLEKYSAMVQIIHSEMDADNIDYLLRDATFSGTSYGLMDMGVLLNNLYIKKLNAKLETSTGETFDSSRYILGVTKKGIIPVEQFIHGKYMAYNQMVYSKYVSILEGMLYHLESESLIPNEKIYKNEKLLKMVQQKDTDISYLGFTDHYIYNTIFSLLGTINQYRTLPRSIINRLFRSCAFDLEQEAIFVGVNKQALINEIKQSDLYKQFVVFYNSIKDIEGYKLENNNYEDELFSYRFETYTLTKEMQIEEFEEKYELEKMRISEQFKYHYYRLGNGIPILDPDTNYSYQANTRGKIDHNKLPKLIVDSNLSSLHETYNLQFVSLRKYKICDI